MVTIQAPSCGMAFVLFSLEYNVLFCKHIYFFLGFIHKLIDFASSRFRGKCKTMKLSIHRGAFVCGQHVDKKRSVAERN